MKALCIEEIRKGKEVYMGPARETILKIEGKENRETVLLPGRYGWMATGQNS